MFHCLLNFESPTPEFPYLRHSRLPRLCIILIVKSWYLTRAGCILLPYYPTPLLGLAINSNIHCSGHKHLVEERLYFLKVFESLRKTLTFLSIFILNYKMDF